MRSTTDDSRLALLASAGVLRLVAEWNNPDGAPGAVVFTVGLAVSAAAAAPLAHALLVHGDGRLRGSAPHLAVIAAYIGAVGLLGAAPALVADPRAEGCPTCPPNLLRVTTDPSLEMTFERWGLAILVAALALSLVVVVVGLIGSSSARRHLVAPVVIPGAVALALVAADSLHSWHRGFLGNDPVDRWLWLLQALAIWLVAGGVLSQRVRARRFRGAIARLVVEVGDSARTGGVQDAVAEALGDPGLRLLHADDAGWIDGNGATAHLPEPATGLVTTELQRDGHVVAALVHRRGLLDDPGRVEELERTAGLALDHDGLLARLRAELAQLGASRMQIVAAGDAERRRLERDLHDGAQQALASLAMSMGLARASTADAERARHLGGAQDAVRTALAELRSLAHRISPAALTDAGLAAALDVLTKWAPQLEITLVPQQRFDPATESAAYFVVASVAEAVSGRIIVAARRDPLTLTIEVRTSEPLPSLVEIEDRIVAVDGRLAVQEDGAVLRVAFPCAS